jgi:cyclopropane-fatty-acyl-phospholipid synthase
MKNSWIYKGESSRGRMGDSTYSGPMSEPAGLVGDSGEADASAKAAETLPYRGEELATRLLAQVFRRFPRPIMLRLWRGEPFQVGATMRDGGGTPATDPGAHFELVFRNPRAVCGMVLGRDPLRLAEAYFRGDVDIEGDLFAALMLRDHLESLRMPIRDRLSAALKALRLRSLNQQGSKRADEAEPSHGLKVRAHSRAENRDAIEFHYDVSNEFYKLWLDRAMVYSCGYFERAGNSLDEAQQAKLEHICRKLVLRPGERFLDIGCGWGALLIHAAQRYGVYAHGVTLSEKQLTVARRRIAEAGLEERATVELKDYRDMQDESTYDKVASIGMFEHVGLKNLPLYFSTVQRLLKPGGLFLNHGITHERAGWQKNVWTEFINRYVFPDGELDNISNIQSAMELAKFEIADVEGLRPHYALTLRQWVDRLERRHGRALEYVSEATYRVWRLYMAACALEFESGNLGIYQVLAIKRGLGTAALPLTRRHLYGESGTVSLRSSTD